MNSDSHEIVSHDADSSSDFPKIGDAQCFASGQLDVGAMTIKFRTMLKRIAAQELPASLRFRLDDSDLVQETLVRAIRCAGDFRGTTDIELQQWLREILKNQLIDSIRFHNRKQRDVAREFREPVPEFADTGQTPSETIKQREIEQRMWLMVAELPEDYRTVVLLRQQMDLSFQEIGERMGKTADAVRMMWGRALVMLGQRLRAAEKRL
jgi:RNA polymerase sigma-70 factor (ECF subfamily)